MTEKKQTNKCCVYDFTIHEGHIPNENWNEHYIAEILEEHCKKWAFQLEQGEKSGKIHWQGRFSLKEKCFLKQIPFKIGNYSVTSKANRDNQFYVIKNGTRLKGPWMDTKKPMYIPKQIRKIKTLKSWQKSVIDKFKEWDDRHINVIYNDVGNIGKSTLKGWCKVYGIAKFMPPLNDFKELMGIAIDLFEKTDNNFIIDMPKAINKDRLYGLYTGIETIKDGYAFDTRYKFREVYMDCPNIWVFTNRLPDQNLLSRDRWKIWEVRDESLVEFGDFDDDSDSESDSEI